MCIVRSRKKAPFNVTHISVKIIFQLLYLEKECQKKKRDEIISLGVNEVTVGADFDYEQVGYYDENGEYIFTEEFEKV